MNLIEIANKQDVSKILGIVINGEPKVGNLNVVYKAKKPSKKIDEKLFFEDYFLEEEQEKRAFEIYEIDNKINELVAGSIGIILGLTGTHDYFRTQKELYFNLYEFAKSEDPANDTILTINLNLFNSQNNQNLDLSTYKGLVISKWEQGEAAFKSFKSMIEIVRKIWKGFVNNNQLEKAEKVSVLVSKMSETTTPTEVQKTFGLIMKV